MDKKEQRQIAAAKREQLAPLRKKLKDLEKSIEKIQHELKKIENELANESLYKEENKNQLTELLHLQGNLKSKMETKESDWFSMQHELEELQ